MKVIADADERKRKMMMSVSSGSGGSSGAFLKYRMVYTPPPTQDSCATLHSSIGPNARNTSSSSTTMFLPHSRSKW
jgi:hypothetical protein